MVTRIEEQKGNLKKNIYAKNKTSDRSLVVYACVTVRCGGLSRSGITSRRLSSHFNRTLVVYRNGAYGTFSCIYSAYEWISMWKIVYNSFFIRFLSDQ